MRLLKILTLVAAAAIPLAAATPSSAATASNSQAGAWGHNKNSCKPTPYFPAGGCLSSFFTGTDDGWVPARSEYYRERPKLRPLND
jgi:hypothetical protein